MTCSKGKALFYANGTFVGPRKTNCGYDAKWDLENENLECRPGQLFYSIFIIQICKAVTVVVNIEQLSGSDSES